MPQTIGRTSSPVAPKVVVSIPLEEGSRPSSERILASRRRSKTESSVLQEQSKSAVEWLDVVEEDPARRRRTFKRRASASSSGGGHKARSGNTEGDIGKFFGTRLGRILESVESSAPTRTPSRTSGSGKASQGSSTRRHRHREETGARDRRPVKHRVGSLSKRSEPLLRVSPSLLSVLSGLTGVSDSSSNTTITQRSYYNRENPSSEPGRDHREPKTAPTIDNNDISQLNVFDYMETNPTCEDEEDTRSVASSSSSKSSHDQRSDAGSSEHPGTPSSLSSCPSPTTTRNGSSAGSVSELRRKYDSQFAACGESPGPGPKSSGASVDKSRRRSYQNQDGSADASNQSAAGSDVRSSSSSRSSRHEDKLRQQHEAMQYHQSISQPQQHGQHPTQPDHDQYRSYSGSLTGSAASNVPYPPFTAMQHYYHPSAPVPCPHPEQPGHVATPDRPPAPDAPDLSKRTLTGYELLALELSTTTSHIQPLYRKFSYLNHRILLHLQDELSEMESQLRTFDEIIAQMEPPTPADQPRQPASRRAELVGGTEVHHRRTALLGRIFLKTEQYSRAMSSFAAMEKESTPAGSEQVGKYRAWLEERRPIHEVESKFLEYERDLVQPGTSRQSASQASQVEAFSPPSMNAVVCSCLPLALMLPILLFSITPTFAGRLTITLLIAGAAFVVGSATRLRELMEGGEWVVCGGVYVLLMAGIAGCVPMRGG
ncbi:hypothetical protein TI39_contig359g00010 [Zymoseptoria brevis]|uniref:DUF6594 domain-containing protein n=1 Tax=Zymoseptoria brevis TaxID=1047168 RepID=A0A0F4GPQ9_9PEZI|nr:hypothetical protein TI39_contig359g00010 [Zymoseptoria brevis]